MLHFYADNDQGVIFPEYKKRRRGNAMRNKKYGKQLLSMLLVGLLSLNTPMIALAESEELQILEEPTQEAGITDSEESDESEESEEDEEPEEEPDEEIEENENNEDDNNEEN